MWHLMEICSHADSCSWVICQAVKACYRDHECFLHLTLGLCRWSIPIWRTTWRRQAATISSAPSPLGCWRNLWRSMARQGPWRSAHHVGHPSMLPCGRATAVNRRLCDCIVAMGVHHLGRQCAAWVLSQAHVRSWQTGVPALCDGPAGFSHPSAARPELPQC